MLKQRLKKRGQVFSGEFMVAYLIFLFVLALLFFLWNRTTKGILDADLHTSINEAAIDAAEQLVRTPGTPSNWTAGNVTSMGLANESRMLMGYKVLEFLTLMSTTDTSLCTEGDSNYLCNKHLLGMGRYDFFFNMTYMNDTTVSLNDTMCLVGVPPVNETSKITVKRTAILDDEIVLLYLTVWDM